MATPLIPKALPLPRSVGRSPCFSRPARITASVVSKCRAAASPTPPFDPRQRPFVGRPTAVRHPPGTGRTRQGRGGSGRISICTLKERQKSANSCSKIDQTSPLG